MRRYSSCLYSSFRAGQRKEEYKQELYRRIALYLRGQREFS